jgi:hypothetical protein
MNQEEVIAKAGSFVSMDIINQLAEKKVWKQRLDGKEYIYYFNGNGICYCISF